MRWWRCSRLVAVVAIIVACASFARAIETGYGEDPVPDTHRSLKPPYTAYGMDPIPVRSPLARWQEFRNSRKLKPRASSAPGSMGEQRWKWWPFR